MSCPACGSPTEPVDRFCGRCGHGLAGVAPVERGLARFCRGCGGPLQPDARFCRACGAKAPDPLEDVFQGMSLPTDVVTPMPPPPDTPSTFEAAAAQAARLDEAPTETISTPSRSPRPTGPSAGRRTAARPKPRPPASAATATMERTPVPQAPPPPATPPRPAAIPPEEEEAAAPRSAFPWTSTLALLGSLAVIISSVIDWGGTFAATMPRDISGVWLLDPTTPSSGPSLGVILLVVGTIGALVTLLAMAAPGFTFLRRFLGLVALLIPLAFALRTVQGLAESSHLSRLPSSIGLGLVMAGIGAAFLALMPKARRASRPRWTD